MRLGLSTLGRLAPGPVSHLATRLFLTPPRVAPPARESWWSAEARSERLTTSLGGLAGWRWGSLGSPRVLLVHGWGGRGLQLGAIAMALEERGAEVATFDGPGHGASTGRRSSLPAMVEAVLAAVDRWGPFDAVVAHSFGAATTLAALARRPDLGIERLVFLAPVVEFADVFRYFGGLTGFPPSVVERLQRRLEHRFAIDFESLETTSRAAADGRRLLVLHDAGDREVPIDQGLALVDRWPGATLRRTQGLGHRRLLHDPRVVAEATAFLAAEPVSAPC
ncbi:MAG: alpha/beta fold hydrolase [Acidobacteriota bacterium]